MKRASLWYSSDDDRSGFYKRNMFETLLKLSIKLRNDLDDESRNDAKSGWYSYTG